MDSPQSSSVESLSPVIFTEPDLIPEALGVVAFSSSEVDAVCHFFNIESPSSDDKMFLLIARRHGFHMLADFSLKRLFLSIRDYCGANLAAALQNTHDWEPCL